MNYPAASSGVSTKDWAYFIVASDGVLDPMLRNKKGASNAILQVNSMVKKLRSETQTSAVSMVDNTTFNKERSWAWPSSQEENI